MYLSMIALDTT